MTGRVHFSFAALLITVMLPSLAWGQTRCMTWRSNAAEVGRYSARPQIIRGFLDVQKTVKSPEDYALLLKMVDDIKADSKFFTQTTAPMLAEQYCGWPETPEKLAAEKAKLQAYLAPIIERCRKVNPAAQC